MVKLFDVQNGKVIPTEHCYTLQFLKVLMDKNPDNYLKMYQYLHYMTCMIPDLNPYFHTPEKDKEEIILQDIEADFSLDNEDLIYALKRCRELNETETSRAYNGIKTMLDKIADYMYNTAIKDGRDGNGSFILSAAKNFHSIRASYKEVYKDLQEEQKSRIRGGAGLAYDQQL